MSLKLKRREFCSQEFVALIRELLKQKLDFKSGIEVAKIVKTIQGELDVFSQGREAAVKKFGTAYSTIMCPDCKLIHRGNPGEHKECNCKRPLVLPDDSEGFEITEPENVLAFRKEETAILEQEVELPIEKASIKISDLAGLKISGEEATALLHFINLVE